jgi:lambda repressor-like predicted transcriptional regulator
MRDEIWQKRADDLSAFSGAGLSLAELSKETGLSGITLRRYATKYGFDFGRAPAQFNPKSGVFERRAEDVRKCAAEGLSKKQAADRLGLSQSTVVKYAKAHGIEFTHGNIGLGVDLDRAEAMAAMYRAGKTLAEIGALYGVTRERVRQILTKRQGMTAADGGQSVKALARRAAIKSRRDKKCIEKHGCTYDQYRELVRLQKPTKAWIRQRNRAKNRGIEWNLKLWDWWQIWQKSGKWSQRGRTKGDYVMCRFGDIGAYEIGNVYIATTSHNCSVQPNHPRRRKNYASVGMEVRP